MCPRENDVVVKKRDNQRTKANKIGKNRAIKYGSLYECVWFWGLKPWEQVICPTQFSHTPTLKWSWRALIGEVKISLQVTNLVGSTAAGIE